MFRIAAGFARVIILSFGFLTTISSNTANIASAQGTLPAKQATCPANPPGFVSFDFQEPSNLTGSGVGRTWTYENAINYLGEEVDIRATLVSLTSVGATPTFPTSTPDLENISNDTDGSGNPTARTVMWGFGQNTEGAVTEAEILWEFLDSTGSPIAISAEFEFSDIDGPDTDGTGRIESLFIDRADYEGHSVTSSSTIQSSSDGTTDRFDGTIEAGGLNSMAIKFQIQNRSSLSWRQRITNVGTGSSGRAGFEINGPPFAVDDCPRFDRSDADGYTEASHNAFASYRIGNVVDAETASIANADATGDGVDDDGITLPTLTQGQTATITADVTGAGGYLQGWVDFNGNGDFSDAADQIATDLQDDGTGDDLVAGDGKIEFSVSVPADAVTTQTFARFRWSTTQGLDATAAAADGEVEDYAVTVGLSLASFACSSKVDLWFANDESGSVDAVEFVDAKDFIYQVTDGFYHDNATGAKSGLVAWAFSLDATDVIVPITDSFSDPGDTGLASDGSLSVDGDNLGIRENYTSRVDLTGGTYFVAPTNGLAARINSGNGRRVDVPQVAIILTDAPNFQIENLGNGGSTAWINAAANLRAAGPDGTRIALVLIAEAADAYTNDPDSRAILDAVVGPQGIVITTDTYSAAADPTTGYIDQTINAICSVADFPINDDYSDAPGFPDGANYGAASHRIDGPLHLGPTVTSEASAQTANGDASDDDGDDGVTFPILGSYNVFRSDQTASVTVNASAPGNLSVWADWNQDGDFDDSGEQLASDQAVIAGDNSLSVYVDPDTPMGFTYMRFRLSSDTELGPTGAASDGEVEDYRISITAGSPFDICTSGLMNSGFEDGPTPGSYSIAPEDTVPYWATIPSDPNAGNFSTNNAIETWVSGYSGVPAFEGNYFSELNANVPGALYQDVELTPGTQVSWSFAHRARGSATTINTVKFSAGPPGAETEIGTFSSDGSQWFNYSGFYTVPAGEQITRFRFEAIGGGSSGNFLDDVRVPAGCDFGDAPDSYGTSLAGGGGYNVPNATIYLGNAPGDSTSDGAPTQLADGDDTDSLGDDEDAVTLPSLEPGQTLTFPVLVQQRSGNDGYLQGWIDWDGNGNFTGTGEQIAIDLQSNVDGTSYINVPLSVPETVIEGRTYARFRWSTVSGLNATDNAPDGEIEDYVVTIDFSAMTVSGTIFNDNAAGGGTAHDGIQSTTEAGLGGFTVDAVDASGTVIASTQSDGTGKYELVLPNSVDGTNVTIRVNPQAEYFNISGNPGGLTDTDTTDGEVTFVPSLGTDITDIDFGLVDTPTLTQSQDVSSIPGGVASIEHVFTAFTAASVEFSLANAVQTPDGVFSNNLFEDANCNGVIDSGETAVSGSRAVQAGDQVCLIARVAVDAAAPSGAAHTFDIVAVGTYDGTSDSFTLTNSDSVSVSDGSSLQLSKQVCNKSINACDAVAGTNFGTNNSGKPGEILVYRITFSNPGSEAMENLSVHDSTPAWTRLTGTAPSVAVSPPGLTCALTLPSVPVAGYVGDLRWDCTGSAQPGDMGVLAFEVMVDE